MPILKTSPSFFTKALILAMLPLVPTASLADWNGNYAGLSLGQLTTGEVGAEFEGDELDLSVESDAIFSGYYGYQLQRGSYVFGGEVAYSAPAASEVTADEFGPDQLDIDVSFIDVKARAGYAIDNVLLYGVVGVSRGSATLASGVDLTADGLNIGIGADYMVSDQFMIGAEFLARRLTDDDFVDAGINVDTTADTFAIRAAFKF